MEIDMPREFEKSAFFSFLSFFVTVFPYFLKDLLQRGRRISSFPSNPRGRLYAILPCMFLSPFWSRAELLAGPDAWCA